jgi:hypothetical protein
MRELQTGPSKICFVEYVFMFRELSGSIFLLITARQDYVYQVISTIFTPPPCHNFTIEFGTTPPLRYFPSLKNLEALLTGVVVPNSITLVVLNDLFMVYGMREGAPITKRPQATDFELFRIILTVRKL